MKMTNDDVTMTNEEICCPEGTSGNSPAFQRWVGRHKVASPEGTVEVQSHTPSFSRPFGTRVVCGMFPGVKTPYVFSVALFSSASPPLREERAGERRLHRRVKFGLPPPRPSPRSSLAGTGRHSSGTLNRYKMPGYPRDVPPGQKNAAAGISAEHATRMKSELVRLVFPCFWVSAIRASLVIRHLTFGFVPT